MTIYSPHELILRQIDSLPTLPAIATRLLSLTASDESHVEEVIELISADPALTAKVLALCRSAEKGVSRETLTVERAVVLLGFNTIRNAVLSVKVFEAFEDGSSQFSIRGSQLEEKSGRPVSASQSPGEDTAQPPTPTPKPKTENCEPRTENREPRTDSFDRVAFWSHSLGVGVLAELLAEAEPEAAGVNPSDAFVCGLLHDLGKIALHHVLPKSFGRAVEMAALNQGNIAEYERRILGLDHHTAGKRLAEQWQLPFRLQDCIWLHGSTPTAVPDLDHRRLVGLVSLADLIARHQHLGYSGNHPLKPEPEHLAVQWGFSADVVQRVVSQLFDRFEQRSQALGLHNEPSQQLFVHSMQRANEALGRLNSALERRGRAATSQARVLDAIRAFHAQASPAQTVQDVLDAVGESAPRALGNGFLALVCPAGAVAGDPHWLVSQYAEDGRLVRSQYVEAPSDAPDLSEMDAPQPAGLNMMGLLPGVADYLVEAEDLRRVQLMPLASGWGTAGVLLHDREGLPGWDQLDALTSTWGAAIAAAGQHEGARRLGEELAEANSALAEAQDRLLRQQSLARLGEMAAGAAHEMNNPLAVISGRSQLLTMALQAGGKEHQAARTIFQASHKLSDLISALRLFASPPQPDRQPAELHQLLSKAVRKAEAQRSSEDKAFTIELSVSEELPALRVDAEQVQKAALELLTNAIQARPVEHITIQAQLEPEGANALVRVSDDGAGMDDHTLEHALDPFFSQKEAGRRMGMGLPRAQQWIAGHGGSLDLRSTVGEGTVATFTLPLQPGSQAVDTDNAMAPATGLG